MVLADEVTPDLVTIASRCVQIRFPPLADEAVVLALEASGVSPETARAAAASAAGDLDRARVLANDPELERRQQAWWSVPDRLDGTGARAAEISDELMAMLDEAAEPVRELHRAELGELEARVQRTGERIAMRSIEERHRRELRRARTDELRSGLVTLARRYRDDLGSGSGGTGRILAINDVVDELVRNPNERLALQALLLRLGRG